jgi:putative SOS response-associated peptidase YedK
MCGRFTLTLTGEQLALAFPWLGIAADLTPRYNIAPSQMVAVVPNRHERQLERFRWGLIPFWAKDPAIGNRMINARAETLAEKPSFRSAYSRRRCLVLADGFYEWQSRPGQKRKTPFYIRLASQDPFGFAGLWDSWRSPDGSRIESCTIITTRPNELLAPIHNRMPVVLHPEAYSQWLDPAELPPSALQPLLRPYPASEMIAFPVSTVVNDPRNDVEECTIPCTEL